MPNAFWSSLQSCDILKGHSLLTLLPPTRQCLSVCLAPVHNQEQLSKEKGELSMGNEGQLPFSTAFTEIPWLILNSLLLLPAYLVPDTQNQKLSMGFLPPIILCDILGEWPKVILNNLEKIGKERDACLLIFYSVLSTPCASFFCICHLISIIKTMLLFKFFR